MFLVLILFLLVNYIFDIILDEVNDFTYLFIIMNVFALVYFTWLTQRKYIRYKLMNEGRWGEL